MGVGKREDALLEHINTLHMQRRSTIRVCIAYKQAFPELAEHMDWMPELGLGEAVADWWEPR